MGQELDAPSRAMGEASSSSGSERGSHVLSARGTRLAVEALLAESSLKAGSSKEQQQRDLEHKHAVEAHLASQLSKPSMRRG
eukprot:1545205-Prymnesium_polylepis.1